MEREGPVEKKQKSENRVAGKWENREKEEMKREWKKKNQINWTKKWLKESESVCIAVFLPAGVQQLVSHLLQH